LELEMAELEQLGVLLISGQEVLVMEMQVLNLRFTEERFLVVGTLI
jgi:hypothetical protein